MGFKPTVPDASPFTLDNIPFGVISTAETPSPRCATAIGDYALDLHSLAQSQFFQDAAVDDALMQSTLNTFASLPASSRTAARQSIIAACKEGVIPESSFRPLHLVTMHLPMDIKGYTDFYCSLEHCQNCSSMSGGRIPDNVLIAPSAYNGRISSIRPSPHLVHRPRGICWAPGTREAVYRVSQAVDFELEMGYFISKPVPYGETLDVDNAPEHIFGFVLLNDWSARDIQIFELPPLGPFNSKSSGTTISPWIVTLDALSPFACTPKHKTYPFAHLRYKEFDKVTFNVKLAAHLERQGRSYPLCTSNLRYLYWTPYQQITHHASAMCGLNTGDLMGTGTVSGDGTDENGNKTELACLFEATQNATEVIEFEDGQQLSYLRDGDTIILSAWCEDSSGRRVLGFGECRGSILPAPE